MNFLWSHGFNSEFDYENLSWFPTCFVCHAISLINNVLDYCSDTILHVAGINPVSFDFNRIPKRQGQSGLSCRSFNIVFFLVEICHSSAGAAKTRKMFCVT